MQSSGAALGHATDGVLTLVGDLGGEVCGPAGRTKCVGAMEGELGLGRVIKADGADKGCALPKSVVVALANED